ncbi:MAG: hypothetical protein ACR2N5_07805 [Solirubrobacterales bacterium]
MRALMNVAVPVAQLGPLSPILDSPAPGPFLAILVGFVLGIYGHAGRMRWLVAIAILIVFIGSMWLFLASVGLEDRPLPPVELE